LIRGKEMKKDRLTVIEAAIQPTRAAAFPNLEPGVGCGEMLAT
jgi:hypothetical protein